MAIGRHGAALHQVQVLYALGTVGGLTDGELLGRFRDRCGQAAERAFDTLIERHGPMVLRVCRTVLRDEHDAQDAFQATFLILVRRAGAIRDRDSVGSWLYGVALRVAECARGTAARRRAHERRAATLAMNRLTVAEGEPDLVPLIHKEIGRLPERFRVVVVLCYLEGLACEEAATQLGWPIGTVKSRLSRARERLRKRLTKRGLAPSVQLPDTRDIRQALPSGLLWTLEGVNSPFASVRGLPQYATSTSVTALAEMVLKTMFVNSLRAVAAVLVTVVVVAGGVVSVQNRLRDGTSPPQVERSQAGESFSESPYARAEEGTRPPLILSGIVDGGAKRSDRLDEGDSRPAVATTEFFSAKAQAGSFSYVIDRSGSMIASRAFEVIKLELRDSFGKLTPDARFSVIFYNLHTTILVDTDGHPGLMAATEANKAKVRTQLDTVVPDGGTDHLQAIRTALAERPEVIFFVTDADLMTDDDVATITAEAVETRIYVVEFGKGDYRSGSVPLRKLAAKTRGTYRYIDSKKLPKP
jgi:RNA polymerase sigma factor (sigma-70 family)